MATYVNGELKFAKHCFYYLDPFLLPFRFPPTNSNRKLIQYLNNLTCLPICSLMGTFSEHHRATVVHRPHARLTQCNFGFYTSLQITFSQLIYHMFVNWRFNPFVSLFSSSTIHDPRFMILSHMYSSTYVIWFHFLLHFLVDLGLRYGMFLNSPNLSVFLCSTGNLFTFQCSHSEAVQPYFCPSTFLHQAQALLLTTFVTVWRGPCQPCPPQSLPYV
jgi:hypothetical protein